MLGGYDIVLYNDEDDYGNTVLYFKKYSNIKQKETKFFIEDLANRIHHKIIIVTYTLTIDIRLLERFKDDLIYISHSTDDKKILDMCGVKYFGLTNLVSSNYMLPIIKNDNRGLIKTNDYSNVILELKKLFSENKLKPLATIGFFLENNKDLRYISNLLKDGHFLIVFTKSLTPCLKEFAEAHSSRICLFADFNTNDVVYIMNELNVDLLFAPPEGSDFFKSQWSGSIGFAINNNLRLRLPEGIAKLYELEDYCVTYDMDDNINEPKYDMQTFREKTYERNYALFSKMIGDK